MEDVMKNVKPTIVGRIRKEAFGGIYYERDRLVIELLNDSAYDHYVSKERLKKKLNSIC